MGDTAPDAQYELGDAPILDAFVEMTGARAWNDGNPMPISWIDIAAWLSLTGRIITQSELEALRSMDATWCAAVGKEQADIMEREREHG